MNRKKSIIFLMILAAVLILFSGCSRKLKKTTTFYSLDFSHSLNYIRLGSDGNYTDSIGLSGTYEIDGDKIIFSEETGSTYNGYMTDSYLYYFAYDGSDQKIPEGNSFDVQAYDGKRTTIYFSADGSVKEHIYQQGIYDFEINGKYSRDGNLITCTYGSQGTEFDIIYYVRDGVLYEAYTSDESRFPAEDIEKMEQLDEAAEEGEASILAVVLIVVILMLIIGLIVFVMIRTKKNREEK